MKSSFTTALIFAIIAAIGNAFFVYGQRRSVPSESPFLFLIMCLVVALICLSTLSLFYPKASIAQVFNANYKWFILGGVGIAVTYVGFYYLYNKFGATYYILYAIISFITTSIIVGIVILKENFNIYYILSIVFAVVTLFLFFLGKQQSS